MNVLVACEYSGTVRRAFAALGHHAVSVDLLPSDDNSPHHYQMSIEEFLATYPNLKADLMIAHPPCTHLAVSGAAWFKRKAAEQAEALDFVRYLMGLDIPRIAIENPVSVISTRIRKPDQIIQPWMFGHLESKATCLWLKGLPKLTPTNDVKEAMMKLPENQRMRLHYLPPSPDRWKLRSKTFDGIAAAMAQQWGSLT